MGPFKRWWNGLGLGWKRINYILFFFFLVYIVFCLFWLKEQYDQEMEFYRWCCAHNGYDRCKKEDFFNDWLTDDVTGFIAMFFLPVISYVTGLGVYQWLKEGFQKK